MNMDEYTHVHVYLCKDIRQGGRHMIEDNVGLSPNVELESMNILWACFTLASANL